jgi:hypothetical protein
MIEGVIHLRFGLKEQPLLCVRTFRTECGTFHNQSSFTTYVRYFVMTDRKLADTVNITKLEPRRLGMRVLLSTPRLSTFFGRRIER